MMQKILQWFGLSCAAAIAAVTMLPGLASAIGVSLSPPFVRPFSADKKGTVFDEVVRIKEHRNYYFMVVFQASDIATRVKVEGLLAETFLDEKRQWRQREPRLLHLQVWELAKAREQLILDRDCRGYEDSRAGASFVEAQFASLKLRPGLYRVRVESLGDIDGFSSLPVMLNLSIGYNQNATPIVQ